jgi:hypothetical protein
MILTVKDCHKPKCLARHVTSSFKPISPLVIPAIALSPVLAVEQVCKSMLLAKSKTRTMGALIDVDIESVTIPLIG